MRTGKEQSLTVCAAIGLAVLTMTAYRQVGSLEFVNLDDKYYVYDNPQVTGGITRAGLAWAFTAFHSANWHPVTWISHMLDVQLFGLEPGRHHIVNVFWHTMNAVLLFSLLKGMTGALWRSAFTAAAFALHPLHVESVAWISERKDLLSTFFGLLTVMAYRRYLVRPGAARYTATILLFSLGLMSKPMLITMPFMLLALDFWPLGRIGSGAAGRGASPGLAKIILEKAPLAALSAVSVWVTLLAQAEGKAFASTEIYSLKIRVTSALTAYVAYIGKTFLPLRLCCFYPHPESAPHTWKIAGAILVISGVAALAYAMRKRIPYLGAGVSWYLITLAPVIGFVQVGGQSMADRYTYLPLIGVFTALTWGAADLTARLPRRETILAALSGAAIIAMVILSGKQTGYWRNNETLYTRALSVTSGNWLVHYNLGVVREKQGRIDEAIAHYRQALSTKPDLVAVRNNLGALLYRKGNPEEARLHLSEAVRLDPDSAPAHFNLGLVLERLGRSGEAMEHYNKSLLLRKKASP